MREDRLIAYQAAAGFTAKRLLVFAPHPDDEVFGCGGALALAVKAKAAIEVVIVTDGALGEAQASDHGSLAEQRARESGQAAQVIGYPEPQFWQLADRSLRYNDWLIKRLEQAIIAFAPDLVLAPSYTEVHPDHRAIAQATLAVAEAFAVKRNEDDEKYIDFDLAFYEVGQPLRPNYLIDIGSVYELKRQAMLCFASQLEQKPYARVIEALNVYRTYTLDQAHSHAEAYVYLKREELAQRAHDIWRHLSITDHPADPLVGRAQVSVSIILPSSASEPFLQVLASQTYPALEWIALGDMLMIPPAWRGFFPKLAATERHATVGDVLGLVQSDWIMFCSGRWGFSAHHIERLLGGLMRQGTDRLELYAAFDGAKTIGPSEAVLVHRSLWARLMHEKANAGLDWLLSPSFTADLMAFAEQSLPEPIKLSIQQPDLKEPTPSWLYEIRGIHIEDLKGEAPCFPIQSSRDDERLYKAHQKLDEAQTALQDHALRLEQLGLELRAVQWSLDHRTQEVERLTQRIGEQGLSIGQAQDQLKANQWEIEHLSRDLLAVKAEAQTLFEAKQLADKQVIKAHREVELARHEADAAGQRVQAIKTELDQAVIDREALSADLRAIKAKQGELDEHLQRSYAFIAHLEQDLLSLKQALSHRDEALIAVQQDARAQFGIAQQLAAELSTIYSSRAWRWITRYRRLRQGLGRSLRLSSFSNFLRTTLWPRLPAKLKQYLRPYTHLMRGAFWVPNSSQNLPALQALTDERLRWLAKGAMSLATVMRQSYEQALLKQVKVDMQLILYQSARWMPAWVDSLFAQELPLDGIQLIVVDHNPGDGSAKALGEAIDRAQGQTGKRLRGLELIEQSNLGFGAGHNRALRAGASPWVLVVNPDLEFEAASLRHIFALALSDEARVASWEFRQKPFEHPKHYDPVSGLCNWSSHACVLLRRSALEAIGGWDERLFMYCEDVAMSYRLREAGYLLRYCPQAVVWHHSYGDPTEVKPAQYIGSAVGQVYLRLRFGDWQDACAAGAILGHRCLSAPPQWRGELLKKGLAMLARGMSLRRERSAHQGARAVFFPFRGLDYELRRDGALLPLEPLVSLAKTVGGQQVHECVSIITRTYGGSDGRQRLALLQQAAACVAQQTWPNLEWVVVEDAACEASPSASFVGDFAMAHPHIKVQYLPSLAAGRSVAGNCALEAASGSWFCFLDDDDLLYADHIETLMQALYKAMSEEKTSGSQQPRLVAAYARAFDVPSQVKRLDVAKPSQAQEADGANAKSPGLEIQEEEAFMHPGHDRPFEPETLLAFNYMPIQAVLFSGALFKERGGFDPALEHLEDWNLWVRYAQGYRFVYVPKTTSMYRTPKDPAEKARRQALLDAAYEPVREKNHVFSQSLRKQ